MFKFIKTFCLVFLIIVILGLSEKDTVEVNSFKELNKYGFELVSREDSKLCIDSELKFTKLEKVNPSLEKDNINLEIEKEEVIAVNSIGENSRVTFDVEDKDICSVRKISYNKYSVIGLKDGETSIRFKINNDFFYVNVDVWHNCKWKEWVVVKESTCLEEGVEERKCFICDKIETKSIPKKPHKYRDCVCIDCSNVLYVNEKDKEVILTESICMENNIQLFGDVVIPEYVFRNGDRYKVVGIGNGLFYGGSVTSIDLPKTIKYIGDYAFEGCEKLRRCDMKEGIGYIGMAAFQCCYGLEWLELPSSVWYIGNFSFNHNYMLRNKIIRLPDSLEYLGEDVDCPAHMFYDCGTENSFKAFEISESNKYYKVIDGIVYTKDGKTLVSIPVGKEFKDGVFKIPEGVENLGELSFSRNKNIKEVVIPDSLVVTSSNSDEENKYYLNNGNELSVACYGYSGVERYNCYSNSEKYKCIDGILYSKDLSILLAVPNQYNGSLIVPEGARCWSKEAIWSELDYFKNISMNKIDSIVIPSSIEFIDNNQIEVINKLVDMYNVNLESSNNMYISKDRHLVYR